MFKYLALAALSAGLVACGDSQSSGGLERYADEVSEIRDVSEMLSRSGDGHVTVDLRHPEVGFFLRAGMNPASVDVLCPGDRQMNLVTWVPELASDSPESAALEESLFLYMPRNNVSASGAPVCAEGCYAHPENGTWVCRCTVL
jgi:hypothetical protein